MKEIPRNTYLQTLERARGIHLIKIITGIRRCGKSYLLNPLFRNHLISQGVPADHIIYINLEDHNNRHLRHPDPLHQYVKEQVAKDSDQYYVLLDEIQLVPDFESVLSSFLYTPNLDTYVTGSNSKFLASDVITEFRGRSHGIHIFPLSFTEFYSAFGGDKQSAWESYYRYGGLPQIFDHPDDSSKQSFLETQKNNVYLNDIIERYHIRNSEGLTTLLEILASSTGSLTNPHKLERSFKSMANIDLDHTRIASYLKKLEDAFIIEKARRYDIKGKHYIDTPTKYYFTDIGIRNAFVDFRQIEENHLMENVIFNELKRRGHRVDVGVVETRTANTRKQLEVDFVSDYGHNRYYIQSALTIGDSDKRAQESRSLDNIDDHFSKIIIAKDSSFTGHEYNGIATISLFDFLLDEDILNQFQ